MSHCNKLPPTPAGQKGVALVVVLSMVVLVSVVLVAFISSTGLDRSASVTYSQSVKADQIARGSLQLVVADLQREMAKDAPPDTGNGAYPNKPIYTNVTGTNIQPQATGTVAGIPALIKLSGTAPSFTGAIASGTVLLSSSVSSTTPSKNGRYVDLSRWGFASFGNFPSNNSAPNWVLLTRNGPASSGAFGASGNTLNNAATSNTNYAIGRFAYAVYDESGLLDVNVAGYPASLSSNQIQSIKGTLAGAVLSGTGLPDPTALIPWRNATSATSASNYLTYVTNSGTNGFLVVNPGDNTFLSRQDLIQAAKNGIAGLTVNQLPSLTTFTRETNSPSWGPTTPAGSNIDYASEALLTTSTSVNNFLIPLVRFSTGGTVRSFHADGSLDSFQVQAGDPLVQRRFPLGRIAWLSPNGAPQNGGSAESIQACFGLVWGTGQTDDGRSVHLWKYVGPNGTTEQSGIETLAQVAAENTPREPNFFELIQAGILAGSLAVDGSGNTAFSSIHQRKITLQVLRIGASIIDQYDSDSCPTVIEYNQSGAPWQACGVENLPYLSTIEAVNGVSADNASAMAVYLLFGLWNPHQQETLSAARPSVRLRVQGTFGISNYYGVTTAPNQPNPFGNNVPGYNVDIPNTTVLQLSSSGSNGVNGFADSCLPVAADAATAVPASGPSNVNGYTWVVTPKLGVNSKQYVGLRMPDFVLNTAEVSDTNHSTSSFYSSVVFHYSFGSPTSPPFGAVLEFQNPLGEWVPYNYSAGINDSAITWMSSAQQDGSQMLLQSVNPPSGAPYTIKTLPAFAGSVNSLWPALALEPMFMTSDPRSLRFGPWQFDKGDLGFTLSPSTSGEDSSLWSNTTASSSSFKVSGYGTASSPVTCTDMQLAPGLIAPSSNGYYYPATLCRNNATNYGSSSAAPYSSYKDRDGIQRIADCGLYPSTQDYTLGNPYNHSYNRTYDRPIVLNRPFYNVGELGCVFRDDPWRSLDFFSSNSADSALLDLFSSSNDAPETVAGRINLNSQNASALASALTNTVADLVGGVTQIGAADKIAATLVSLTATNPLVNKADLVNKLSPFLAAPGNNVSPNFATLDEQNIKSRREAFIRALADVGQTRTWNFMIDIIAQSGKYPSGCSGLDQFVVEGERRYWLHVAIDRFTGVIVDQKIEPVME